MNLSHTFYSGQERGCQMNPTKKFYLKQSSTIIKNLSKRNMSGYYCETSSEAVELALSLIKPKSTVSFGGSMTLQETGLISRLNEGDYHLLDRNTATTPEAIKDIYIKTFSADSYFMSTNAISLDGQLVNIDGNGNRVAPLIYGPDQVIILAGMNKVATTLDSAINRVKNFAAPTNVQRLSRHTPCSSSGFCQDCQSNDCICSNTVITRRSSQKSRIKVILIGEVLGY